jgi:hypothetical protein
MAGNQTLAIVKPDAVERGKLGAIIAHLERGGLPDSRSPHGALSRAGRVLL